MARVKARGRKLGSLVYNPGGPGQAATEFIVGAASGAQVYSSELLEHYDIVGLDPRGTGFSHPVMCDPDIWNERVSLFPKTTTEFQELVEHNRVVGDSCAKLTGPLINHLDTIHVVKDLELIGYTYAELYPENVNHIVGDGILDHGQSEATTLNGEAEDAYERTLDQFFEWCKSNSTCFQHKENPAAIFDAIVKQANSKPIPAPGCSSKGDGACRVDVTGEEIRFNAQGFLGAVDESLFFPGWLALSEAIALAAKGNATLLSTHLATSKTSTQFPGMAIGCQDWSHNSKSTACIGWPAPNTNPQGPVRKSVMKAPKMLLVNSLYDPENSYVWANSVRNQVPNSVLLTRNGGGHTSYQLWGKTSELMDRFLITGELPKDGTIVDS
ncbi:hypothetical protein NA57DRAFT_65667 [Rhizodiscina lignyota]|uniref:Peptidase S33 tripeptidyl aminopeptidase-like C-terminal domain-containing protein n=1 Tax=Rhizodiscina lignyota TaxID=1504668 RepID=A0A9P4IJK7_9PEZI|nr:hypothetical protein NA57DRAFT_65667 [Rhizodiscina lignyota]